MALIDTTTDTSVAAGAKHIRRLARHGLITLEQDLLAIAAEVTTHTKAAISAELGADAAEFASMYDNGRAYVLANKPSSTIPTRASLP